ncbi:MAG: hypothetical protein FWB80_03440 [Defluviitaleaceae bacterium]|nr:hypothetical protein [Defluviitaleaceae bacterium]
MKKLIGNEIVYLHSPNINVCFKARIGCNFSNTDFENAANAVEHRHPILKSVVKTDAEGQRYYEYGGGISLQFYTAEETDWQAWYAKADNTPFNFESESFIKIAVIRGEGYSDIVFLGHHILGDGIGYLNLMRDFFCALDGKLDDKVLELPAKNNLKKKGGGFLLKLFAAHFNRQWNKSKKIFTHQEYVDFFAKYREQNPSGIYLAETEKDFLPRLKADCKTRGVTVNEAVITAFAHAVQARNEDKMLRVGCAASIRDEFEIPTPNHMGNYVTGISIDVENADDIPSKLREKFNDPKKRYLVINFLDRMEKSLIESVMYAGYGDYDNPVSKKLAAMLHEQHGKSFGVSNLGVQDFNGFSFDVSDVWFVNPAFPQNFLTVGLITVNGVMKFCLRYSGMSETQIVNIYNKFMGII